LPPDDAPLPRSARSFVGTGGAVDLDASSLRLVSGRRL